MNTKSRSDSYAAAGVDITAGYRAVELMKKHIRRTEIPGAYAVGAGYQNRLLHACKVRQEQSAESAHIRADTGDLCPLDMLFHQLDRSVTGSDINASGGVGFRFGIQHD